MDEKAHEVPYDIELPIPIMFWDPLEFVLAVILMGFGIISNLWIFGLIMGAGVLIGSRYMKRGAKKGAMQHFLWAHGLQLDPAMKASFAPSWDNDFTE